MTLIMDEALFNVIYESSLGMSLTGLWGNTEYADGWVVPAKFQGFDRHRQLFFFCLRRMLNERKLLLQKNWVIINDSVDDQIENFQSVFPLSNEDVNMGGGGVWFYTERCPAEPVWVMAGQDGAEWFDWA